MVTPSFRPSGSGVRTERHGGDWWTHPEQPLAAILAVAAVAVARATVGATEMVVAVLMIAQ